MVLSGDLVEFVHHDCQSKQGFDLGIFDKIITVNPLQRNRATRVFLALLISIAIFLLTAPASEIDGATYQEHPRTSLPNSSKDNMIVELNHFWPFGWFCLDFPFQYTWLQCSSGGNRYRYHFYTTTYVMIHPLEFEIQVLSVLHHLISFDQLRSSDWALQIPSFDRALVLDARVAFGIVVYLQWSNNVTSQHLTGEWAHAQHWSFEYHAKNQYNFQKIVDRRLLGNGWTHNLLDLFLLWCFSGIFYFPVAPGEMWASHCKLGCIRHTWLLKVGALNTRLRAANLPSNQRWKLGLWK